MRNLLNISWLILRVPMDLVDSVREEEEEKRKGKKKRKGLSLFSRAILHHRLSLSFCVDPICSLA